MSEINTVSESAPGLGEGAAGPVPAGTRLRLAREQAGISLGEVARSLRLGVRQIEALEAGDWASLPGKTFVRGFVRNYARMLRLDPEPLMQQLDAADGLVQPTLEPPATIEATMPEPESSSRPDLKVLMVGAAAVIVAVALYFLLPGLLANRGGAQTEDHLTVTDADGSAAPEQVYFGAEESEEAAAASATTAAGDAQSSPAQLPVTAGAGVATAASPSTISPPVSGVVAAVPAASTATATAAAPVSAAGVSAASGTLAFEFDRDSWVEVRDKEGQVLASRLYRAGSRQEIGGKPPFSLTVGNASHVKLRYNGQTVALEPRSAGDVARLAVQ